MSAGAPPTTWRRSTRASGTRPGSTAVPYTGAPEDQCTTNNNDNNTNTETDTDTYTDTDTDIYTILYYTIRYDTILHHSHLVRLTFLGDLGGLRFDQALDHVDEHNTYINNKIDDKDNDDMI